MTNLYFLLPNLQRFIFSNTKIIVYLLLFVRFEFLFVQKDMIHIFEILELVRSRLNNLDIKFSILLSLSVND